MSDRPASAARRAGLAVALLLAILVNVWLVGEPGTPSGSDDAAVSADIAPRGGVASALADHPLLQQPAAVPTVDCELPAFGQDTVALTAYYLATVRCLDQVWEPVLLAAALPFEPPAVDISAELKASPCGAAPNPQDAVAYYCGLNHTIYLPIDQLLANGGDEPASHLATLSHEYGHHVQRLSGLLGAADAVMVKAGLRSAPGLEMSRRVELQADCFAGMFLHAASGSASIDASLAEAAEEDFNNAAEEPVGDNTHGSATSQGRWADNGYRTGSTDSCNTFAAAPDEVL
ncbi:neutral zinc metallopeptidase [Solihabitans fulvus]|uniref:neutral zinc metallopeptidase n=1 Tax=Solihabitans fulvus TaxID=1892852 RepID=UPI0016619110|nr:neutral zinc metallopeptidase [Solihabitans fulvus]